MNAKLKHSIDDLYMSFSDVPKPEIIVGCPCCIERKGIDVLLKKRLREITPDELSPYAASAFLTVGDLPDYLYLLPRILEIVATDSGWWPSMEVIMRGLKRAQFETWSERHRTEIMNYINAVLEDALEMEQAGWLIDDLICGLGQLFDDVSPYLKRLMDHPEQLISYYEHNGECLIKGKLTNSFWEKNQPAYDQVLKWFDSSEVKNIIKTGYGF